jgi:DNA-binding NarL/FixJ family response regulator
MRSIKQDLIIYHLDDEAHMRESFKLQLNATELGKKFKLKSFATAEGLLAHTLNATAPSVLVLDYLLDDELEAIPVEGKMTGRDLATICRSLYPSMGIMMRSSLFRDYDDRLEQASVRSFGADRFVPKNPTFNRLEEAILQTLRERNIRLCA